ncbi:MAG: bifunctional diguanylate cyclase/phosphodiesterase [Gammaproteobacteria bacterium]
MSNIKQTDNSLKKPSLSQSENIDIDYRVKLELNRFQQKMVIYGGVLNMCAGIIVILSLLGKAELSTLLAWYTAVTLTNIANWSVVYKNRLVTPAQIDAWRRASREYHIVLLILCLTWGCISILHITNEAHFQLYVITFLQLGLLGLSFGTVTDYVACVISNISLLLPYMIFHIYTGIHDVLLKGHDSNWNISLSFNLLILSLFLLIATYFGYKLVRKFFKVSFENVALSEKLEHANQFLEKRVKERTLELEDSLKLVTYQATHDLLTGLPNQRLLLEYINTSIDSAKRNNNMFALASICLNEIEKINDGFGHQALDQIIKTVAQRFQNFISKIGSDGEKKFHFIITLSRKDVFVLLLEPVLNSDIDEITERIFSIFDEPVYIEKQAIKLTISIGLSVYPEDGQDGKSLLMNADAAMLHAKKRGGNSLNIYDSEINATISKRFEIESYLHNALQKNEFTIQYQPFFNLKTGKVCGGEALIRWNNPMLGSVPPADFIPLAEANGLIIPLGEWVLQTVCLQTKKWQKLGYDSIKIAVNLSAKQLQKKNIIKVISDILLQADIDPKFIEIELTETEAFQKDTISLLKQIKMMGLNLSIDDFGTGYSGLNNLKLFEIDKLKIDKSFVQDLSTNNDSKAIVSNTISLAKKIHVSVLAEGVETEEQLDFLQENGCDMIQGFYFSQPLDPDEFTKLLGGELQLAHEYTPK